MPWGLSQELSVSAAGLDQIRAIRQMGVNTVRTHLQFRDVMATCTTVKPNAVADLQLLLRRLQETGLYVQLVGLSSWLGDDGDRAAQLSCYADATEADRWTMQATFWRAVASAVAGSSAVLGLDLMNEPMVPGPGAVESCWLPQAGNVCGPVPAGSATYSQRIAKSLGTRSATDVGKAWVKKMTDAIRPVDPTHNITLGCFAGMTCAGMSPAVQAATEIDYLSPHVYPKDCSKKGAGTLLTPPETDNDFIDRCTFLGPFGGEAASEYNGTIVETDDSGNVVGTYDYHGSGDGLTYDLNQLSGWAAANLPVVVGETGTSSGGDLWRLIRTTMASGATDGWIAIFVPDGQTLSQLRAPGGYAGGYYNGRLMQRVGREVAPCGNCGP